jgi:hypothetical protein
VQTSAAPVSRAKRQQISFAELVQGASYTHAIDRAPDVVPRSQAPGILGRERQHNIRPALLGPLNSGLERPLCHGLHGRIVPFRAVSSAGSDQLTGTFNSQIFGEAKITGSVKGNVIEFGFEGDACGQKIKVSYKGTIESPSVMKGTAVYAGFDEKATWSAVRK